MINLFEGVTVFDLITLILALYAVLQVIVRLTPTKKDDKIVSVFGKVLNFVFQKTNISNSNIDFLKKYILETAIHDITAHDNELRTKLTERAKEISGDILNLAGVKDKNVVNEIINNSENFVRDKNAGFINREMDELITVVFDDKLVRGDIKKVAKKIREKFKK